jgi:hypothetical protein
MQNNSTNNGIPQNNQSDPLQLKASQIIQKFSYESKTKIINGINNIAKNIFKFLISILKNFLIQVQNKIPGFGRFNGNIITNDLLQPELGDLTRQANGILATGVVILQHPETKLLRNKLIESFKNDLLIPLQEAYIDVLKNTGEQLDPLIDKLEIKAKKMAEKLIFAGLDGVKTALPGSAALTAGLGSISAIAVSIDSLTTTLMHILKTIEGTSGQQLTSILSYIQFIQNTNQWIKDLFNSEFVKLILEDTPQNRIDKAIDINTATGINGGKRKKTKRKNYRKKRTKKKTRSK